MKWLFHKCRHYQADLSLLAANDLEQDRMELVQAHLKQCPACQAKFAQLQSLVGTLEKQGQSLPDLEASVSLRRRWTKAVRESARPEPSPVPWRAWISNPKLAWSSLAAIWALALLFRFSAPDASKPVVTAASPSSWRQVMLVLHVESPEKPPPAQGKQPEPRSLPKGLPPRSRGPGTQPTADFQAS